MPFSSLKCESVLTRGLPLLITGLLVVTGVLPAHAQPVRVGDTFYGKLGVGVSDYTGDFPAGTTTHPLDFQEFTRGSGIPFVVVGELGYQFSSKWGLAVGFQGGNYPIVGYSGGPSGISDSYRFAPQVLARYTFASRGVAPYLDLGANATFGGDRPPTSTGFGPSVGGGVDFLLSRALSFYVESRFNITFPDDAVDGAGTMGPFDLTGQLLGFGLKVSFTTPTPPRILQLDGPTEVEVGASAAFSATINGEKVGRPVEYRWAFGDGETATGLTAAYTYDRPGTYEVSFSASNKVGEASESITVVAKRSPKPPRITVISAVPDSVPVGTSVQFRVSATGSGSLTYEWSLGDGTTVTGTSATHTYAAPGEYTVRLRVSNEVGTETKVINLRVARRLGQKQAGQKQGDQEQKERWGIVVASMSEEGGAEAVAKRYGDRFSAALMPVEIVAANTGDGLRYRVVLGQFESVDAALQAITEHEGDLPSGAWILHLE